MGWVFCEQVKCFPLDGDHMTMLGTTYGDPYRPALAALTDPDDPRHCVDSFGWSVGDTFGCRLHDLGVRWEQVWSLSIRLTPSLPTGQVGDVQTGESVNRSEGVADYLVEVGLSPEAWAQTPVLGKRTLLAELGTEAVRGLAARQGWDDPADACAAAVRSFRQDEEDLRWIVGTKSDAIELPREVYEALVLDAWSSLDDARRAELVEAITRALHDAGRPLRPLGLRSFGPKRNPLAVAQWRDDETGVPFSLIGGATFRPGYRREQVRQAHVFHQRASDDEEEDYDVFMDAEDRYTFPPRRSRVIHPYESQLPCDLGQKRPVKVPPFLLASEPLLGSAPGLDRFINLSEVHTGYSPKDGPEPNQDVLPVCPKWTELAPALRLYGWSLPSSAEFEWALRGGLDTLFYWGNTPPDVAPAGVMGRDSFEAEHPRAWPWCNRFGLAAPLVHRTWCLPLAGPDEAFPLVSRGGTNSYPGQDCGEWWLFCSAVECRECLDDDSLGCALRPAIRFRPQRPPRRPALGRKNR